jgi:integrase/recombinase XerC
MSQIQAFVNYLSAEKRFSKHTVIAYQKDLEQFSDFLEQYFELKNVVQANRDHIRSWVVYQVEKQLGEKTINRKISTLKSFYKYLLKSEVINVIPTNDIATPKLKKKLPQYIPREDMSRLLDDTQFPHDFEGVRDKLMIELLYCTGIRSSELMELTITNVCFNDSSIKVLGKRKKERIIPLTLELNNKLKTYVFKERNEIAVENNPYLFVTIKGKQIYHGLLYKIVNKYLSLVSRHAKKSPHVLRHTFATHMLNNGADLNGIKTLLGHTSLAATQIYTHNSIEQLKSIHKQAHPRGGHKNRED